MKRKIIVIIMLVSLFLTGCMEENTKQTEGKEYFTQFAQSPAEYTIFLDKEITEVTNILATQNLLAKSVLDKNYPKEDALDSASQALEDLQAVIFQVDGMNPPEIYEKSRVSLLNILYNCQSDLEAYKEALESDSINSKKIEGLRDMMQADFIALTGIFAVG